MRTSSSHPLKIAEIHAGDGWGKVGLTFCPGKIQPDSLSGGWNRDLDIDLDAIVAWGATAIVTLIEPQEMSELGVSGLGDRTADRHLTWFHLPIRDVDTPDERFEAAWTNAGETIRSIIRGGSNVLIHCKGGLGRAGMISARLLAELGWDADDAIIAVRRVRPGAIETRAQEHHVRSQSPVSEPIERRRDR